MTHRGLATSVRFLTGHSRAAGEAQLDESIAAASDPHTTLIVYMGLKMLPTLTEQLTGSRLSLIYSSVCALHLKTSCQSTVSLLSPQQPPNAQNMGL